MKKLFTILLLFVCSHSFAQDDSLLQMLIDSVKNESNVARPEPSKKDTQLSEPKGNLFGRDSVKPRRAVISDSLSIRDSLSFKLRDSLSRDTGITAKTKIISRTALSWNEDTAFQNLLLNAVALVKVNLKKYDDSELHIIPEKDYLFYALVLVVLLLAIIRQLFPKYFQNLFRFLFEASFRQKQRREQLMQEVLPSLLMNIFFVLTGGLFVAIMAYQNGWLAGSLWQITLYSISFLALTYIFKYAVIQITGWIFNAKEPASTYSFIVFLVNKIIGFSLLPLLLLLAFSESGMRDIAVTIAACLVIFLILFRYIISLSIIRSSLSIHPLHFFIYLCAVELMPMLIIFKLLFSFIGKSN